MNKVAANKIDILRKLSLVPENRLETVKDYLDVLLADVEKTAIGEKSLKGIWKGSGFEKLVDLEEVEVSKISFQDWRFGLPKYHRGCRKHICE